jgi:hypothetical protein
MNPDLGPFSFLGTLQFRNEFLTRIPYFISVALSARLGRARVYVPSSRNAMVFQAVSLGMPANIEIKIEKATNENKTSLTIRFL